MVVLVVHAIGVLAGKSERHAPVAAHLDGPCSLSTAVEFVEIQARQIHVARARGHIQAAEALNHTDWLTSRRDVPYPSPLNVFPA